MSYLKSADIDDFRRRLLERNKAVRDMLRATVIASLRRDRPGMPEVHDIGEESFSELTLGVDLAAHARELEELRDVEAALRRIAQDRFGYCADCGEPVGRTRLDAFPTAKRCLPCQQRHELKRSGGADMSPSL